MDLSQYSILAIVLAAVSSFAVGGLWYSPLLFGPAWMRESGMTEEKVKQANMAKIYGLAFVLSLLAAFVFALFLGPDPAPGLAAGAGFAAGAFWVAASFGINYLFEQKSLKLFLINGGYHTVQFTLIGLVLGLWP
jgi:hypothetical protein